MNPFELEDFIKSKAAQFENLDFIANDPISIVHRYKRKEDIEIIGLLIATIAWGNRKSIIKSGNKLSHILGESPYDFVLNFQEGTPLSFVHRTFNSKDLEFFLLGLKNIYNHGGLEYAFKNTSSNSGMIDRISNFRSMMLSVPHETRSEKHISNPLKNSACKRINMFLRWMVRSPINGVDFGIWKNISPSELFIPLDVHTGNIARKLGILTRKQNDWQANEEMMSYFRKLDPNDPSKFDFALFGLGAIEGF